MGFEFLELGCFDFSVDFLDRPHEEQLQASEQSLQMHSNRQDYGWTQDIEGVKNKLIKVLVAD